MPIDEASPPTREEVEAHCRRLSALAARGRYVAGGPFGDERGGGLVLATFDDLAEATRFAESDPFVTCGYEVVEVRPWSWSRPENGQLGMLPPTPGTFPGFLEALELRATTRRFADEPVDRDLVLRLLEVASTAPSEFNLQPWRPVVCHDLQDRIRLRRCCLDQSQVQAAGVAVVCSVDPELLTSEAPRAAGEMVERGRWMASELEERLDFIRQVYAGGTREASIRNGLLYGHHLLLAGFSQGLAGFWLGGFDEGAIRREFSMPARVVVAGVVGLGWPRPQPEPGMPRRAIEEVVGWGRYPTGV